jgi:hypothetical protein
MTAQVKDYLDDQIKLPAAFLVAWQMWWDKAQSSM